MNVYICIVCMCGHTLHSGILEQCYFVCTLQRPLVHLSLEAKRLFSSHLFFNGLLTDERLLETEKIVRVGRFEGFVISVKIVGCLAAVC